MTAVTTEVREIEEPKLADLRSFVERAEERIEKLSASLTDSRRRRENLGAERGSLIMPARAQKDSKAQKRLYEIDEQLPVLDRDIKDDEVALYELNKQLTAAEEGLERAEWEIRRAAVRGMIEARLKGKTVGAIQKAVEALAAALQAALDEDEAIKVAMVEFEPRLRRDTNSLYLAGLGRSRLAAWKLQKLLPVDTRGFGYNQELRGAEFADGDCRQYGELLKALNRLELVF